MSIKGVVVRLGVDLMDEIVEVYLDGTGVTHWEVGLVGEACSKSAW